MRKPIKKGRTPPGGWTYTCPDGVEFTGHSEDDLVDRVCRYYRVNSIEYNQTLVHMDILDQICSRIPTDWCDNPDEVKYFHPTLSEVESVTRAIIKRWTDSDALPVDDDTARKRADVCLTNNEGKPCVQYRRQPTCWSCGAIYAVIKNLLGVSRAGNLEKLHVCGICRCAIGTIAYCNIKVLAESTKRDSLTLYPDGCWKRKELEEYFNGKENTAG